MIKAKFTVEDNLCRSFKVSGHSGYSVSGSDIICASVSAFVQSTLNMLVEVLEITCQITIDEDTADIACVFIKGNAILFSKTAFVLKKQLEELAQQYEKYIKVI